MRSRRLLVLAALGITLGVTLGACASGPNLRRVVTLQPQDDVMVRYYDSSNGLDQRLQNGSATEATSVYSQRGADPALKVVPDEDMQVLLDALATLGFYEHATPVVSPGAKALLAVDHNGERRVWSRVSGADTPEEITAFNEARTLFLGVFNNTLSFHTSDVVSHVVCPSCQTSYPLPGRVTGEHKCQACNTLLPASAIRTRPTRTRSDVQK